MKTLPVLPEPIPEKAVGGRSETTRTQHHCVRREKPSYAGVGVKASRIWVRERQGGDFSEGGP